jgi:hypothetical protein
VKTIVAGCWLLVAGWWLAGGLGACSYCEAEAAGLGLEGFATLTVADDEEGDVEAGGGYPPGCLEEKVVGFDGDEAGHNAHRWIADCGLRIGD